MVRDLQQVNPHEAGGEELWVDLLFDVPHQQEPPRADLPGEHDRHVVDARPAVGRLERNATAYRPQDAQVDLVDGQAIAGGNAGSDGAVRT